MKSIPIWESYACNGTIASTYEKGKNNGIKIGKIVHTFILHSLYSLNMFIWTVTVLKILLKNESYCYYRNSN